MNQPSSSSLGASTTRALRRLTKIIYSSTNSTDKMTVDASIFGERRRLPKKLEIHSSWSEGREEEEERGGIFQDWTIRTFGIIQYHPTWSSLTGRSWGKNRGMSFVSWKHWTMLAWFFALKRNPGCSISCFKHSPLPSPSLSLSLSLSSRTTFGWNVRYGNRRGLISRNRNRSDRGHRVRQGNRWIKEHSAIEVQIFFSPNAAADASRSTRNDRDTRLLHVSTNDSRSTFHAWCDLFI